MNPRAFLTIWYEPRATIRRIIDTDPYSGVLALVAFTALIGMVISLKVGNPVAFNIGTHPIHLFSQPTWRRLNLVLIAAVPLLAIAMLYISGALLRWAGGLLGGTARSFEVRAAIAWAMVPTLGFDLFRLGGAFTGLAHAPHLPEASRDPRVVFHSLLIGWETPFALISTIGAVWAFVVLLKCIGEVHRFSAWRALGAQAICSLTIGAVTFLLALAIPFAMLALHLHLPRMLPGASGQQSAAVAPPALLIRPVKRLTPPFTADQAGLLAELNHQDFARLDQQLSAAAQQAIQDPLWELNAKFAFEAFATDDARTGALLDQWVKQAPNSYAAHMARAEYLYGVAITQAQSADMNRILVDADTDLGAVLDLKRDFFLPHEVLLWSAMSIGGAAICKKAGDAALAQIPASEQIRAAYMNCLQPRAGGSYKSMEEFAHNSQALVSHNPRLALLLGIADYYRGYDLVTRQDYTGAIAMFNRALAEGGDSVTVYEERGQALGYFGRFNDELADYDRAAELESPNFGMLSDRARALFDLGRYPEALASYQAALQLRPSQSDTLVMTAYTLTRLGKNADAIGKLDQAALSGPLDSNGQELKAWLEKNQAATHHS